MDTMIWWICLVVKEGDSRVEQRATQAPDVPTACKYFTDLGYTVLQIYNALPPG